MKTAKLLLPLALLPVAALAQTSVFSTNFSTGERVTTGGTYDAGDFTLASTKAITGIAYGADAFRFGMNGTTSGFVEAQSRFTNVPVALATVGDWIKATVKFTAVNNILAAGANSSITMGLYDSGGANTTPGLETGTGTGTLSATASSPFTSGFAAGWEGYVGKLAANTGSNQTYTRPVMSGVDTSSQNQDLLFNNVGGGAYDTPTGVVFSAASPSTQAALTNTTQYTLELQVTLSNTSEYTVGYTLYDASGVTTLQSITGVASAGNFLANLQFDGIAIGYRSSGTSLATSIELDSLDVTRNTVIPEPSTYAALAGAAALGLAAWRRRRS